MKHASGTAGVFLIGELAVSAGFEWNLKARDERIPEKRQKLLAAIEKDFHKQGETTYFSEFFRFLN